ncbi:LysR substrate-binding domain-containing protein [Nocardioides euryhalodurans]|uniref:LysR family transcriptional regulator n=1 Tax=Nocardioides euryhalodurans TaxID=2518370 RepID=A0A4P7GM57_9ACTN|nr:LysR substrate-binding domain-containing protein [Nocardioides euryhalodurans]QBR92979.1 LysR family transcriptional regulator [Nocardioides euryhalodurans]
MDVLQLRYLIAIVDAGSLSRAADGLRVSQPALSQRMTQLERELGVQLVERGPRGVRPTQAGLEFYRDAHRLVRQFDHLASAAAELDQVRGLVSVGLPSGAAAHLAAPLFRWTRAHCPGVRLELFESMSGYVDELFAHGRMDLAVMYVGPSAGRADDVPLYTEDLYLVGEPPVPPTRPDRISVAELAGVPIVAPGSRSSLRRLLEQALRQHDVELTVVADVESLGTMLRIAEGGDACAMLPLSTTSGAETVAIRRIEPVISRRAVLRTATDASAPAEAVAAVRSGILSVTHELAEAGRWPGIRPEGDPR